MSMKKSQYTYRILLILLCYVHGILGYAAIENGTKKLAPVGTEERKNPYIDVRGIERHFDTPESYRPENPNIQQATRQKAAAPRANYTYAQLAAMSVNDALNAILSMESWRELTDAFFYSQGAADFYHNVPLMDALFSKLKEFGSLWNKTDQETVDKISLLVEILRAGPYLGFYFSDMADVNDMSFKNRFIDPVLSIINNPDFGWSEDYGLTYDDKRIQDQVIAIVGTICGSGVTSLEIMEKTIALVKEFNDKDLMRDPSKADALWSLCGGMDYALYWSVIVHNWERENSPYYNKINEYIDELARIALYGMQIGDDRLYVELSGIYWLVNGAGMVTPKEKILPILQQCLDMYPRGTAQWMETISRISYTYANDFPDIDFPKLKQEVENDVLPLKYVFDNGKRIFITGSDVDPDKVKMLYWATKEVRDKFYSLLLIDQPIDGHGRPDDVLTAYIYNSPAEYKKYNGFLYGLSTDNGGMYIEGWGKFFTYERTIYESTLSLEDLFRHEFVHYLQGRYLCPGEWGAAPLYTNDRLTWVEEGSAEFQAGSSRANGIPHRRVMVAGISNDPYYRMTLHEVVRAKYSSGFTFYTYAYVTYQFMYERHPELMFELYKVVQAFKQDQHVDNIEKFFTDFADNYAQEYWDYMNEIKSKQHFYNDPITPYDYCDNVTYRSGTEIFSEITSLVGLQETQTSTFTSDYFDTFEIRGKYEMGVSEDETKDRVKMSRRTDEILNFTLTLDKWNGYKTVTARFVNYEVKNGKAYFDLVFSGLLPEKEDETNLKSVISETVTLSHYPNPVQSYCTIDFSTVEEAKVSLKIYDSSGKLVKTVLERRVYAGMHNATVDLSDFTEGMYFYTLIVNEKQLTKKMIILK